MTRPYAEVIGDPIAHSKSPLIHNFWLGKLGIDADYRACHVRPEQLADYFTRRRGDAEWRGCNVTMPHKIVAIKLVQSCSEEAGDVGAINTVTLTGDRELLGNNTDVIAIREIVEELSPDLEPEHYAMVDLIGAGGAARAAMVAIRDMHPEITIWARDKAKADELCDEMGIGSIYGYSQVLEGLATPKPQQQEPSPVWSHLIVNASPLGMEGYPPLEIYLDFYPEGTAVFDMVYSPLETDLLREARRRGFRTVDGLSMLIGQAAAAFEKFFGQAAPRQHDAELRELLTR